MSIAILTDYWQMPATRPATAEPREEEDATTQEHHGTPFTLRFDKLVIAVGAYSQSTQGWQRSPRNFSLFNK